MERDTTTADELLQAVHDAELHLDGPYYDHCCQFCGSGPGRPFASPFHPEQGPHVPSCLWLKIEKYLKDRAQRIG